jgi:hypothetical protein
MKNFLAMCLLLTVLGMFPKPDLKCPEGQVVTCTIGTCYSTLLYCPQEYIYKNGYWTMKSDNCNNPVCDMNCRCADDPKPEVYLD